MDSIDISRKDPLLDVVGFRLSWGAIWAGLVIATVIQIVLSVLSLAIGLAAWNPGDSFNGFGVGAAIWLVVTAAISLFVGGVATGRLAGILKLKDGILHAVVLWGLSTLLTVWMVASGVGSVLGGTFNVLSQTLAATAGGVVSTVGSVAGAAAQGSGTADWGSLQSTVASVLNETGVPALSPDSLQATAQRAGNRATGSSEGNQALAEDIIGTIRDRAGKVDREAIVNVIVARTDMSRAEADRLAMRVSNAADAVQRELSSAVDTLQVRAGEVAESTTSALSTAAWLALATMIVSLAATIGGAAMTARN